MANRGYTYTSMLGELVSNPVTITLSRSEVREVIAALEGDAGRLDAASCAELAAAIRVEHYAAAVPR